MQFFYFLFPEYLLILYHIRAFFEIIFFNIGDSFYIFCKLFCFPHNITKSHSRFQILQSSFSIVLAKINIQSILWDGIKISSQVFMYFMETQLELNQYESNYF